MRKTSKVLVVTPWFPSWGHEGAGVFNLRDAELLAEDHDVTVIHLVRPDWYRADHAFDADGLIRVIQVPFLTSKPATWAGARRAIRQALRSANYLHTMAFPALIPFVGIRVDVPWIHTEHWSGLIARTTSRSIQMALPALRRLLRRPDEIVSVGQTLADAIDEHRAGASTVIGNYVRFSPLGRTPLALEHSEGAQLRMIGVGNLIAGKGPIEAVDMLAELNSRGVYSSLSWAGSGPLADEMNRHALSLGVADRLHLLGQLAPAELTDALLAANLFVLPTAGETFGVAIAEALGHGLPVVASGVGGHVAFLGPEYSRMVPSRTSVALADAVQELVADSRRWGPQQIRDHALSLFSNEARRDAYQQVYCAASKRHADTLGL